MRKLSAVMTLGYVIVIVGCSDTSNETDPAKNASPNFAPAIQAVMEHIHKLVLAATEESKTDDRASGDHYLANLGGIDIRGCPPDFQQAFLRYKQGYVDLGDYAATHGKLRMFAEGIGAALAGRDPRTLSSEADGVIKNIRKAQFELESIAIQYGVQSAFREK